MTSLIRTDNSLIWNISEMLEEKKDGCFTGMLSSSSASGWAKVSTSLHLNRVEIFFFNTLYNRYYIKYKIDIIL